MDKNLMFYYEWLPIEKKHFRVLAMLADVGEFKGNSSDLCRYFSLSLQTSNRNAFRDSITWLSDNRFITAEQNGRNYILRVLPQATGVVINAEYYQRIRTHDYHSESVAWQVVLKVLIWLTWFCQEEEAAEDIIIQNAMIAEELNVSEDTVSSATNVLTKEYEAMSKETVKRQVTINGKEEFRTLGQIMRLSAFWNS